MLLAPVNNRRYDARRLARRGDLLIALLAFAAGSLLTCLIKEVLNG